MHLRLIKTFNDKVIFDQFAVRYFNNMTNFKKDLAASKNIIILTGAGASVDSGIPTFRAVAGRVWRNIQTASLSTPEAFAENPSLVWEYYHFRRERTLKVKPNAGHYAIAKYQEKHRTDKNVVVVTQNADNLHIKAGSINVIELHGNLFQTKCLKCKDIVTNFDSPICPALANRGSPREKHEEPSIPVNALPHCKKANCNGLLRPNVLWYGEDIDPSILAKADAAVAKCNMCLVIGTSLVLHPVALMPMTAVEAGAVVAEFNMESSPSKEEFKYFFQGPFGKTIPEALKE